MLQLRRIQARPFLTGEDLFLYILAHAHKHFSNGGTGLRTLADIYVFIRSKGSGLDRDFLDAELEKLGLKEFERQLRELAFKTFAGGELSGEEEKLLMYLVRSGTHGNKDNLSYHQLVKKMGGTDAGAKKKYLHRRVFISGKALKKNYPFVYRHRAMYPLLLVYRPIKGAIKRPKELIDEYRKVKNLKERDY